MARPHPRGCALRRERRHHSLGEFGDAPRPIAGWSRMEAAHGTSVSLLIHLTKWAASRGTHVRKHEGLFKMQSRACSVPGMGRHAALQWMRIAIRAGLECAEGLRPQQLPRRAATQDGVRACGVPPSMEAAAKRGVAVGNWRPQIRALPQDLVEMVSAPASWMICFTCIMRLLTSV